MKKLTVCVLLAAAAGCTPLRTPAVDPLIDYEPLQISLLGPANGLGFWVNKPAYVAVFDIVPGAGVRLAYPIVSAQLKQKVTSGSSLVRLGSSRPVHLFATRRLTEPHIILAIASLRPLNISHTVGFGDWINYKLGAPYFLGSYLGISNTLLDEIVPAQPADDWATAMYLVYPNVEWRRNVWQLVRCSDGNIYVVNSETDVFQCPSFTAPPKPPVIVNDDRARRPALASRTLPGGQLPVIRAMNDVVVRPPSPPMARNDPMYVRSSGTRSRTAEYRPRGSGSTPDLGVQPSTGASASAGRPMTLEPSTPSTTPPGSEPSRGGEKPTKANP